MEAKQKQQSNEKNGIKKSDISIVSTKFTLGVLTHSYFKIKMNKKYLISLDLTQNDKLYIYTLKDFSIFTSLQLKESINYIDFHKNYETIFCVAIGNDILIYYINMEKKMVNEISKIQGHFSKVIYTEFSPYDPYLLLSVCYNNDIKIFTINNAMPKNHIFYEQALDILNTNIKWTKNQIGVLSKDRKTILISSQNNFLKGEVWEKEFKEKIIDFHFYDNTNEEFIIVLTKKSVIFVDKKDGDKLIYKIDDGNNINYSFYFKKKKILIIFINKTLIGFALNFHKKKKLFETKMDETYYQLFFCDEKIFENNEICKFFNIEDECIYLFSVNLNGYSIKEINNKNNSDIKPELNF